MTSPSGANPEGGQVVVGGAAFDTVGNALNVTTATDRTVINWDSFSIGTGQITHFIQPDAGSAVLNRVIGSMPSEIAGQLVSNGRVGLINQNGILVTSSGVVNTNGFFASALDLTNDQFMGSGALTFKGESEAVVGNSGLILARQGDVFLIGRTVTNSGTIEARDGNVALAAGSEVTLQKAGDGRLTVTVPAGSNKGSVEQSGTIQAVQQQLRDNGGNPYVLAMRVDPGAEMSPEDFMQGQVAIHAGQGRAEVSGTITAGTPDQGGEVTVEGGEVELTATARVDVSGDSGGGTIKLGGGFQGRDAAMTNSQATVVRAGATLAADARVSGNGGTVIVWSDRATAFGGAITARGGTQAGDGGFVEVSGKQWLGFSGQVLTLASAGRAGTLLLDPTDLEIVSGASNPGDIPVPPPNEIAGKSTLTWGTIEAALANGNLVITTASGDPETGDITVTDASPDLNTASHLTLDAAGGIILNGAITNTGGGALTLTAAGGIDFNAGVTLSGGVSSLSLTAGGAVTQAAGGLVIGGATAVHAGANAITLTSATNDFTGAVSLSGGAVQITTANALALGTSNLGSLVAVAGGHITQTGALTVTGTTSLEVTAANSDILLHTEANDFGGAVSMAGTLTNIRDFGLRNTNAGAAVPGLAGLTNLRHLFLTFDTAPVDLSAFTASGNATISASGAITQSGDVAISGLGAFSGSSITLGAGALTFDAGTLTFNSAGAVAITEDSAMDIVGINTAGSAALTATGGIADAGATSVNIAGLGEFVGVFLNLGQNQFNTGTLTFNSGGTVAIREQSALDLVGDNTAASVTLVASGALSDAGAASVTITGLGEFEGTSIDLGAGLSQFNSGTLSFTSAGAVAISEASAIGIVGVNTAGSVTLTSAAGMALGGSITTGTTQTYNGAVTLANATQLTGGTLTLASGMDGNGQDLTLDFSTPVTLPAAITGVRNFLAEKAVVIDGAFVTSGTQHYKGAVETGLASTLTGTTVTFDAKLSVAGDATAGTLNITGDLVLSPTATLYVTLGGTGAGQFDRIIVSGAGNKVTVTNATLTGEVTGVFNVGDKVTIIEKPPGNVIGDFASGSSVNISGQGFDIDYADSPPARNISLTRAVTTWTWDGGGAADGWSLKHNWVGDSGVPGNGDAVVFAGATRLTPDNDLVGLVLSQIRFDAGASAFVLGGNALSVTGGIVNNSNNLQTVDLPVTLAGNQAFATTGTGALTIAGALNGDFGLTLTGPNRITLGGVTAVNTLTADAAVGIGTTSITTTGVTGQRYNGAVILGANIILNAGAGDIFFAGTVDGAFTLQANSTGVTTFGGAVGGATPLVSLQTNAGGTAAINGGSVTTTGAQTFGEAVGLGGATVLTGSTLTLGAGMTGGGNNLTLDFTTPVTLPGSITGVNHFVAQQAVNVNGGFTTAGSQTYNGAVTLTGNSTLTGTSLVLSAGITGGGNDLTLDFSTPFTLPGSLTGVNNFVAQQAVNVNGIFTTAGSQTYNGVVTLTGNSTLTGTSLTLAAGLTGGGNDLTLDFSTPFTLPGGMAGVNNFAAQQAVRTNGAFTTTGNQTYNGAVTLTGNTTLDAGAGNILFTGTVDGAFTLAANSTGATTFGAAVGGITPLAGLQTNAGGTTAINGGLVQTTGAQIFGDAVSITVATTLDAGTAAITAVNVANDFIPALSLTGGAVQVTDANSLVLGTIATSNLTVVSTGALNLGTGTVTGSLSATSNGGAIIQAAGGLTVTGPAAINAGAGTITLADPNNDFGGAVALVGAATRVVDRNELILGTSTVASLDLTAGGHITQTGPLTVAGATSLEVTAAGSDILLHTEANNFSGAVSFAGTLANVRDFGLRNTNAGATVPVLVGLTNLRNLFLTFDAAGIALPAFTASGNAMIISGGAITDTGNISIGGLGSFSGTSITLGSALFNTGTLTFNSAGAVIIDEDSALDIVGANTAGSATLTSVASISDAGAASVNIAGLGTFAGTAITLGGGVFNTGTLTFSSAGAVVIGEDSTMNIVGINTAGSAALTSGAGISDAGATSVNITGLGTFAGTSIALGGGSFNTGTLTFNSAGAVTIDEDSTMSIVGINTAGSATLTSVAGISDAGATSVNIGGLGTFAGTGISLGGGAFNTGTLTFNSAGAVTISEDSAMNIVGANTAGSATLTSVASISDAGAASVDIAGLGTFAGTSISLGGGVFNTDTLTFNSAGAVTIDEDSAMHIVGANTAGSAALTSVAGISDAGATSVDIAGLGTFAGTSINLGGGVFNTGTLTFNSAGAVTISEDSAMHIVGINTAGSATLNAVAGISDAGAASVNIAGLGAFAGTSISLGGGVFNTGTLNFNSAGAVTISEDSAMDIAGINTAGSAALSATGALSDAGAVSVNIAGLGTFAGTSISLGGGVFNTGTLTFNSAGAVVVSEDSSTDIAGSNTAGSLALVASGSMRDVAGTSVTVGNDASFRAMGAPLVLNDLGDESLTVGGNAAFEGSSIMVGSLGTTQVGSLTFNSPGLVNIQVDSDAVLANANTANSLTLETAGSIADAAGTSLTVTNSASLTAVGSITLADNAADNVAVGGAATLRGTSILVGALGTANFGTLNFDGSAAVVVRESSAMQLVGVNRSADLRLQSDAGAAGNLALAGSADVGGPATVTANGHASLLASGAVQFGDVSGVNAAGTLDMEAMSGNFTMGTGATATAAGDLRAQASGHVTLTSLTTAGNARIVAGGNIIDPDGDTVSHAANGFATLTGSARAVNLTAAETYLQAGGRIGTADANPLDLSVGSLATRSGADTSVLVTGDVTLQQVATTVQRIGLDGLPMPLAEASSAVLAADSATGDVRIETLNGNLTVGLGVVAGSNAGFTNSDVMLVANGAGKALAVHADVTADDDVGLRALGHITSGAVQIRSTGVAPGPNGGTIDMESFFGNVSMGAGSVVGTASGHIRVAAESAGATVSLANLTAPNLVALISDADLTGGVIASQGLYAESKNGSINLATHVTELAARALGSITINEADALSIGLSGGTATVDRVALDNSETDVASLVSLGGGVGLEPITGNLNLSAAGTISQTAAIVVANGHTTLASGAAGDIDLRHTNFLKSVTVTNARNVAIRDIGGPPGSSHGLLLSGTNNFSGQAFVVATTGGLRFASGTTTIIGVPGSKAVFIGGETRGLPGTNEVSGNIQSNESISAVNLPPDIDVIHSDIVLIGNSVQSNASPLGGYIRLINSPADPIRNLQFNYSFPGGGVAAILADAVDGGAFGASLGGLGGLSGDTAVFFSSAPYIDLAVSDAAEEARRLMSRGVTAARPVGVAKYEISAAELENPVFEFGYFGPFWTIGYDFEAYRTKLNEEFFPLYYHRGKDGRVINLLNPSVPVERQAPPAR